MVVGNDREIVLPDLTAHALGRSGLRGLRCVHTHLKGEPLTQDDHNDLALLRLDLIAAIAVGSDGLPGAVHYAHLVPPGPDGRLTETLKSPSIHALDLDFATFVITSYSIHYTKLYDPAPPAISELAALLEAMVSRNEPIR